MMADWFRSVARKLVSAKRQARDPQRARRARVALECLEDRVTPSTAPLAVTSYYDSAIYEFNATTGTRLGTLVAPNSQTTLQNPAGITVGPDGNLYISSQGNDSIVEYNLTTHSLSTFIPSSVLSQVASNNGDAVFGPAGITFGPDGDLYVALSGANGTTEPTGLGGVVRFDITDNGSLAYNTLSTPSLIASGPTLNAPDGLVDPTEMTFGVGASNIDTLYVSDSGAGSVVAIPHALAQTPGAMTTVVAAGSGAVGHTLNYPSGLAWAANGDLEVVDLGATSNQGQILTFKLATTAPSTTITAGSNGKDLSTVTTIDVKSTAAFPASGSLFINAIDTTVSYTGKTATSFIGVTGGTGTLATGMTATSTDALATYVGSFAQPLARLNGAFPSDAVFTSTGQLLTADLGPSATNGAGTIDEFAANGVFLKTLVGASAVSANANSDFTPSQLTLNLGNVAPTVPVGGNYSVNEGSSVTLHATATDAQGYPLTYSWNINGDSFGQASGANPTLTWAQLEALGVDYAGTFSIQVIVSDGHGQTAMSQPMTLTVNYVPVTGPTMVVTSFFDGAVYQLSANGTKLLNTLVAPYSSQSSILTNPADVTDGPDGNLYISNQVAYPPSGASPSIGESIVEENLSSDTLTTFIPTSVLDSVAGAIGDTQFVPAGITFGPDGNLYVALNGGYDGSPDLGANGATPGAIVRFNIIYPNNVPTYAGTFSIVATTSTVGGSALLEPEGIAFGVTPSTMNDLYVANSGGGVLSPFGTVVPGNIVKITDATGANPTPSIFVPAGAEGLTFPSSLLFEKNGDLVVTDFGGSVVTAAARIERYGPNGQILTPLVASMPSQFPSDAALTSSGDLVVADLGPNYPPYLLGAVREYSGAGTFLGMLESSSEFATTGPGDSGYPSDSGFSPSALVLNAGTRAPVVNPVVNPVTGLTGFTVKEGSSVTLNVQAQDPNGSPLTYSWDVNGDGTFGDAVGKSPTLTWAQLVALGINQTGTWQVQVMVSDADGHVVTSNSVPLTVTYTAPTIRIGGLVAVVVNKTFTLDLATLPAGAVYNFNTWTINWGDNTTTQGTGPIPSSLTNVYTTSGRVKITVTATDSFGTYYSINDLYVDVLA